MSCFFDIISGSGVFCSMVVAMANLCCWIEIEPRMTTQLWSVFLAKGRRLAPWKCEFSFFVWIIIYEYDISNTRFFCLNYHVWIYQIKYFFVWIIMYEYYISNKIFFCLNYHVWIYQIKYFFVWIIMYEYYISNTFFLFELSCMNISNKIFFCLNCHVRIHQIKEFWTCPRVLWRIDEWMIASMNEKSMDPWISLARYCWSLVRADV